MVKDLFRPFATKLARAASLIVPFVVMLLGMDLSAANAACPLPSQGCVVPGGTYMARPPASWDGLSPLPVLVHFHGFRERADELMAREDLHKIASDAGLLLVVPQGAGQTWSHPGSPSQLRYEVPFIEAVLADVRQRWPVDERRLWASGFSQGGSMVWTIVCHHPHMFAAYLPISGAFWKPEPRECVSAPRVLRHIHGLSDRVVPLEGRPIRGGAFQQGDVFRAMGVLRRASLCVRPEIHTIRRGALVCESMKGCSPAAAIEFCLHVGGHDFDPSWIRDGWRWVQEMLQ